jgi:Uma2 family endonuclease
VSSLERDRAKAQLYAECGVPEYWIVNVVEGVFEVHSEPRNGRYMRVETHARGARVSPRAFGDVVIAIDDVLG